MPKLSKSAIDCAKYIGDGKSRCVIWDDGTGSISGFGARIYPPDGKGKTKKSFIFMYRADGRKRMMVLGSYGAKTVDEARKVDVLPRVQTEGPKVEST